MLKHLTLLFVFLFSISAFTQVVIEERVEIGGSTTENNFKKVSSIIYADDIPSGFIMPKSGMLQVYYSYVDHFDWELPDYSTLNTYFFKGDSTSVDSLSYRYTSYIIDPRTFYNYCPPPGWENRDVYMYLSPNPYLYDLGNVAQGDSVQMIYHSDMLGVEGDIPISEANEVWDDTVLVGWEVTFRYYDACILEYVNVLQMFVGVMEWDSIDVSISPAEISVGDTTQVIIKKRLPDGTLVDFDSTQTYEIAKLEGCLSGNIVVDQDSGAYFYDVSQPIYFVVADSLDGDSSGTVLLRVGLVENEKAKNKLIPENIDSYECFTGNFNSSSYKDKSFPVGPSIELMDYADNDNINGNEPAMPEFPIQLEITNDTRGDFDFLRYYLFLEWKNTQQTGEPVYGGGVTKLVQLPSGGSPAIIDFNIDWDHPNPGFICGGDELTLRIDYKGVTKYFELDTDILGDNPVDKTPVVNYLDTKLQEPKLKQMKVIVYKENSWKQFWNNGYCTVRYYGSEAAPDWGMCQLNKETPTIGEIWNWKENINSGIAHLDFCYIDTEDFYNRKKEEHPDAVSFTNDELLIMTAQRYNKGRYYADWVPYDPKTGELGHWRRNKKPDYYKYGDDFWNKYENNIY